MVLVGIVRSGYKYFMRASSSDVGLDEKKVRKAAQTVWGYKQGQMVATLIHLGQRMELFKTLSGKQPATYLEIAQTTGKSPRWIQEWLRGMTAANLLEFTPGETHLPVMSLTRSVRVDRRLSRKREVFPVTRDGPGSRE